MAQEAAKDEVVTPEMIEAGVSAYLDWESVSDDQEDEHSLDALVRSVFRAMAKVAPRR